MFTYVTIRDRARVRGRTRFMDFGHTHGRGREETTP